MTDEESLSSAIHEEVKLLPYDPRWPAMFAAERDRLMSLVPESFISIQHFGSTAVPGLAAKPVIDILAGVASMAAADSLIEPLCRAHYTTSADFNAGLAERRWLMRWANGQRTHHLHLVTYGGHEWQRRLAFRDALRSDRKIARRYELLKFKLAALFADDREAYSAAKTEFVQSVIERL